MQRSLLRFVLASLLLLAASLAQAETVDLLIVAGQSNAVGYNAIPGELPQSDADEKILFWWKCGDPPPDEHDSHSGGAWKHLQPQPLGNPKQEKGNRQYGNFAQKEGGFGPEIGLARTLYLKEQKPLAVVKAAFSGTGLHRDWDHTNPGEGGSCYRALIAEVQAATAAAKKQDITLRPRAFVWVQGESDANPNDAPRYAQRLADMVAALRKDLNAPGLPALVAVNTKFGGGRNTFMPTIVAQQELFAERDPRAVYVDTSSAPIANSAHYDTAGTIQVGESFAAALIELEARLKPQHRATRIVTLGDSITKGARPGVGVHQTFAALVQEKLRAAGQQVDVINVGIGGERTDLALARLSTVVALAPDIVTVMYGTNDSYIDRGKTESRITLDAYRQNLNQITAELLRRGIKVVLMTEPRWAADAVANGQGENPNIALEPYVETCRETAKAWRVPLVDHFAMWTKASTDGTNLRDWTTDGCHPNIAGHQKLTALMVPVLEKTIGPELKTRAKLLSGEDVRVVCFGDSVTGIYYHTGSRRAYTDMLGIALGRAASGGQVTMFNAGISGHTTENALARIDRDVLERKPDLVTVMFGLNDMVRVPLEKYRENLKEIVAKCRGIGAEVVLATPNNVVSTGGRSTEKLLTYCDAVREVAAELEVPLCDTYREYDALRAIDPAAWQLLMSDAIHPNMDGHQAIATALAQTITGLRIPLDDIGPVEPYLPRTAKLLSEQKPIRVLAMPPLDEQIESALQAVSKEAKVELLPWPTAEMSLSDLAADTAKVVRPSKPDLVLIALPRSADASDEQFITAVLNILKTSVNFGPPSWDCVVVHPDVFAPSTENEARDALIRQLTAAHDLPLLDRTAGDNTKAETLFANWFAAQLASKE